MHVYQQDYNAFWKKTSKDDLKQKQQQAAYNKYVNAHFLKRKYNKCRNDIGKVNMRKLHLEDNIFVISALASYVLCIF